MKYPLKMLLMKLFKLIAILFVCIKSVTAHGVDILINLHFSIIFNYFPEKGQSLELGEKIAHSLAATATQKVVKEYREHPEEANIEINLTGEWVLNPPNYHDHVIVQLEDTNDIVFLYHICTALSSSDTGYLFDFPMAELAQSINGVIIRHLSTKNSRSYKHGGFWH